MPRILEGYTVEGKVIPYETFKPFLDLRDGGVWGALTGEQRTDLIQRGEESLAMEYPLLTAGLYREFRRNGNRSHYEDVCFKRRQMVLDLMMAECLEGQGRFVDKLIDGIWAILEETSWVIPAHNTSLDGAKYQLPDAYRGEIRYVDLFSAETGSLLAWVYHFLKDVLEEAVPHVLVDRMQYELNRRILEPYLQYDMPWMGLDGGFVNNWNPWIVSNVLAVAALCEEKRERREAIITRSLQILDCFAASYDDDGGCDEGPGYWGEAGAAFFDALELLYDMTGGELDIFQQPLVRAMGEYIMKMYIHDNFFINFADCHGQIQVNYFMIARFGRRVKSKSLEDFAVSRIGSEERPGGNSCWNLYRRLKNLWDVPKSQNSIGYAPKTFEYLAGIQIVAMREQPRSDKGLYVAIKGGHNGESHNHNDVGNFIVYCDGMPVVIDAGVDTYTEKTFSPLRYTIWSMRSSYHTLPDINGAEQAAGEAYQAKDFTVSQERMSVSLDIAGAYPKEARVRRWIRQVQLAEGRILISETVEPELPEELELHYLLLDRPDIAAPGRAVLTEGLSLLYPYTLVPEIEEIEVKGTKIGQPWNRDALYRLRLRGRIEGETVLPFQILKG